MMSKNDEVTVFAHRGQSAEFTVPNGATRKDVEKAIAEKLRSDEGIVWRNNPEGVNVDCILNSTIWKPRRRFYLKDGEGE
jgi:hypothetical protein